MNKSESVKLWSARLDAEIGALFGTVDRLFALSAIVVATATSVGIIIQGDPPAIVAFASIGLSFLLTYLLQVYTDIEARLTIRDILDNDLRSGPLQPPSAALDHHYRNRISVKLTGYAYTAVLLGITCISWTRASEAFPENGYWIWGIRIAIILSVVMVALTAIELFQIRERTLKKYQTREQDDRTGD